MSDGTSVWIYTAVPTSVPSARGMKETYQTSNTINLSFLVFLERICAEKPTPLKCECAFDDCNESSHSRWLLFIITTYLWGRTWRRV